MIKRTAGICWYSKENYPRVLAVMADADVLPRNFHKWLKQAETSEKHFRAQGWIIHRVDLDPDAFLRWCTERNVDANADARMAFANDAVARLNGNAR
ncbi:hypothetical protein [Hyphomicrobium sp. MC8b]|uniref:hypothetical protein n=1 Tax=Hyphomicrobium sp. MC8b TaxID=300273 RepID=UPI00391A64EE